MASSARQGPHQDAPNSMKTALWLAAASFRAAVIRASAEGAAAGAGPASTLVVSARTIAERAAAAAAPPRALVGVTAAPQANLAGAVRSPEGNGRAPTPLDRPGSVLRQRPGAFRPG